MSDKDKSSIESIAKGFAHLSIVRQAGLLLGLSASIALGFAIVLWSKEPNYRPVFSHLEADEAADVLDVLQFSGIPYKLDQKQGRVMVPVSQVYEARLKLANEGLPRNTAASFAEITKEHGLGTSRFMENARYLKALESELSQTISKLRNIKNASVHLAIPKESVFINEHHNPSASVLLDVSSSVHLSVNQVSAIARLVASSVPNLKLSDVTVVDQLGNLLSDSGQNQEFIKTKQEFAYTRSLEETYAKRIEAMLTPLLGINKVRAKVSALIDFSSYEQTREIYNPEAKTLRSEKILDESKPESSMAGGVPGAASNIPLDKEQKNTSRNQSDTAAATGSSAVRRQALRNYEVGKTISHSTKPTGKIQKLTVAVLVDDHSETSAAGDVSRTPLTSEEITKITKLVENAIGFDASRGDQISVANITFAKPKELAPLPKVVWWKQNIVIEYIKKCLAAIGVLLVILLVLRPALKNLSSKGKVINYKDTTDSTGLDLGANSALAQPNLATATPQAGVNIPAGIGMDAVKNIAQDDPRRIAQVMKNWVGEQ